MDFDSFLAAWMPYIDLVVGRYQNWSVPSEDLRQEATIVLWEIYERYGPDREDVPFIVLWAVPRRLKRLIQSWRTKELLLVDKTDSAGKDDNEEEIRTIGSSIAGTRDIDLPLIPSVLTDREKKVILLKGLLNYSWDEVANKLGMSPNTARKHWTRSRVKLERLISGGTEGDI